MKVFRTQKSTILDSKSRNITNEELEKVNGILALDGWRKISNGGKKLAESSEHVFQIENVYKQVSDVPKEYQNEFIDAYTEEKNKNKSTYYAIDLPNGVFIIGTSFSILKQVSDDGEVREEIVPIVEEYFIDNNGKIKFFDSDDIIPL